MVEYIVIREHAGDLAQAVCVDSSSNYPTGHGPYEVNEGEEGGNEGHERSEGHDQGSAFGWVGQPDWDEGIWAYRQGVSPGQACQLGANMLRTIPSGSSIWGRSHLEKSNCDVSLLSDVFDTFDASHLNSM